MMSSWETHYKVQTVFIIWYVLTPVPVLHCSLVTTYMLVNIGSGYGLFLDFTKPLPDLKIKPQSNLNKNAIIYIQGNAFENVACKVLLMVTKHQCVIWALNNIGKYTILIHQIVII